MPTLINCTRSTTQSDVNSILLHSYRNYLEEQSPEKLSQFNTALSVYDNNFDNAVNPLLNRGIVARLTDIVQLRRASGEISSYNYKVKHDQQNQPPVNGTARALIKSLKEQNVPYHNVIEVLSEAGNHPVFTAHPTSVFNMKRVEAHRDGKQRLLDLPADASDENVFEAMHSYSRNLYKNPLVKTKQTVHEEVDTALYHEENFWNAIPNIYGAFDNALAEFYPNEHHPQNLKMAIKVSSWVMGDKDGNTNIDEKTTLGALKQHRDTGQKLLQESFQNIVEKLQYPHDEHIKTIQDILHTKMQDNARKLETIDGNKLNESLQQMLDDPLYQAAHKEILTLMRQVNCFGTHMGKIEYRENSQVLMQALNHVLKEAGEDVSNLSPEAKETLFTDILNGHSTIDLKQVIQDSLDKDGDESEEFKAFQQTFGRFEIALLNPSIVENHVIAEAQENFHILGVEVIKKAVTEKLHDEEHGFVSQYSMRTTPLYESPEDLIQLSQRMDKLTKNEIYQEILEGQKDALGFDAVKQVFKVAMSDTMRRGSLIAARIAIHKGIKETLQVLKDNGIDPEVDFGGSYTDSLRDGCKPQSFKARLYELANMVLKGTVQGIDAVHFFNGSATGAISEEIISSMVNQHFKEPDSLNSKLEDQIDSVLYETLDDVVDYYEEEYFNNPQTNAVLEKLDVNDITTAGNTSSRSKGRKSTTTIHSTRSITFSEAHQHNGLTPGYLAAEKFQENIASLINQKVNSADTDELTLCLKAIQADNPDNVQFMAKSLNFMFNKCALMRDVVDRVGYCCAVNDFEIAWPAMFNEPLPPYEALETMANNKDDVKHQAAWMARQHMAATKLTYAAQTGAPLNASSNSQVKQAILQKCYPHFQRYTNTISNVLPLMIDARKKMDAELKQMENDNKQSTEAYDALKQQLTELHGLGDTIVFSIPDPAKLQAAHSKFLQQTTEGQRLSSTVADNQTYCNSIVSTAGLGSTIAELDISRSA